MRTHDISVLSQLHRVRATRLVTFERDLQARMVVLREIDSEADACRAELAQAQRQRDAWENEWQSWLSTNGVLSRGEDYSRYHVVLVAWERDVHEQLAEILVRRKVAADAVDLARSIVRKAQVKLKALGERLEQARQMVARARSSLQQREAAELATIAARQVRAARMFVSTGT